MKLRQLRFFVKVVETGNITKAAEQLNVAQTAIGLQMRNLEEDLNVQLLERHSRGVQPTAAGKLLYDRALQILQQIAETRSELSMISSKKSSVRFGATPSILKLIGAELIVIAREVMPEIELHVVEELSFLLVDSLNRNELDFVLAYNIQHATGLQRVPLLQESLLHIAAPGFGADKGLEDAIDLRRAFDCDLALVSERDVIWQVLADAAKVMALDVKPTYWVQSMQGIKTLIQHEIAQSIMPYGIVAEQVIAGELEARTVVQPPLNLTLSLAYFGHLQLPNTVVAMRAFAGTIVKLLARHLGEHAQLLTPPPPEAEGAET